ncbi:hypothetical protein KXW98_006110 [Aspergillus fumigatus]|nr:hypothetical protein CNMCM8714_006625 [Aspergillus fumigatus]KAF4271311.1 hypothetical protein CNMCM8812_000610 [Aspergillus fumigatus]KAF4271639.1 hypothetical protein CNMCM8057_006953 [Aspergillus fumigatus]KAF4282180.1 hypothetical protein CNMCM8689_008598 [Aspergillus fumigatus]KAF4284282.1 hypothetical protein CNMCM8686_005474 [Aspergillus fumigatus]
MLSATALITWAPKCSESHFYKKSSKDIVPSPCFTTKATTIGFLRTVPETGDLSMDTEAKKLSSAASTEADAALGFLASEGTAAFTEIVEEKLVRKIDWTIVPLMWAIYFLQYQDKFLSNTDSWTVLIPPATYPTPVNYASVMGLLKDTGMQTDQFSKLALAF